MAKKEPAMMIRLHDFLQAGFKKSAAETLRFSTVELDHLAFGQRYEHHYINSMLRKAEHVTRLKSGEWAFDRQHFAAPEDRTVITFEVALARLNTANRKRDELANALIDVQRDLHHITERHTQDKAELETARERIAIQDQEIADLKEAVQQARKEMGRIASLFNQAFDGKEQAQRALVLQVLATHEKPSTQKPS